MIDYPKTLEQAQQYRYFCWAGNPKGRKYQEDYCAYEVWEPRVFAHQCNRKNGYGPNKLYCKQHANIIEQK